VREKLRDLSQRIGDWGWLRACETGVRDFAERYGLMKLLAQPIGDRISV
jgi:hypothetical protein